MAVRDGIEPENWLLLTDLSVPPVISTTRAAKRKEEAGRERAKATGKRTTSEQGVQLSEGRVGREGRNRARELVEVKKPVRTASH